MHNVLYTTDIDNKKVATDAVRNKRTYRLQIRLLHRLRENSIATAALAL